MLLTFFEWLASLSTIIATIILAFKGGSRKARLLVFCLYIVSNIIFVFLFYQKALYGAVVMNIIFFLSSIVGIYKNRKD